MDLKLNKEELVTLSEDTQVLNEELTPAVAGGGKAGQNGDWTRNRMNPETSCTDKYCELL